MYQQDYEVIDYPSVAGVWITPLSLVYGNVDKVRLCPTAQEPVPNTIGAAGDAEHCWGWGPTNSWLGSYTLNGWLYNKTAPLSFVPDDPGGSFFKNTSAIRHPSQTPFFADGIWPDVWVHNDAKYVDKAQGVGTPFANLYSPLVSPPGTVGAQSAPISRVLIARHGSMPPGSAPRKLLVTANTMIPGAINVSFVDGHAESIKLNDLWQYYWNGNSTPMAHP